MVAMAKAKIGKLPSRAALWRPWAQVLFLLVWLNPLRMLNVCGPVYHCYACPLVAFGCPVGIMANFSAAHIFPFAALGTLLVVGGLVGGFVCGWACPFGFFQDLLGKVPGRKFRLPSWTGHFRYVVLAATVVAIPYFFGKEHPLFICAICPAGTAEASIPALIQQAAAGQELLWPNAIRLTVLGVLILALLVKYRPWCTLLCPLGAIFGLCNRLSVVRMGVNKATCTSCGACDRMCRYGVRPEKNISDPVCIGCLECTRCDAIGVETVFHKQASPAEERPGPRSASGQ